MIAASCMEVDGLMVMAKEVDALVRKTPAIQSVPITISDNAGLDSAELLSQRDKEKTASGTDVITGGVGDMEKLGICESFMLKQAVLFYATVTAEMILRVDKLITCAPRRREDRMWALSGFHRLLTLNFVALFMFYCHNSTHKMFDFIGCYLYVLS